MPIFKALKKIMLSLRKAKNMEMSRVVESDEMYVAAGLKGRNNSEKTKKIVESLGGEVLGGVGVEHGEGISQQSSSSLREVVEKTTSHQEMLNPRQP
jgi:hypothetical protein